MCGVVAFSHGPDLVGLNLSMLDFLLQMLQQLMNRGQDSCGIALTSDGTSSEVILHKIVGSPEDLGQCLSEERERLGCLCAEIRGCGLGHTRWSTNGPSTLVNAHPHAGERLILVHNGIISNHQEIRQWLAPSRQPLGSTDSEVILTRLEQLWLDEGMGFEEALLQLEGELEGSWALVIIDRERPGILHLLRHRAPLLCLLHQDQPLAVVASEEHAFHALQIEGSWRLWELPDHAIWRITSLEPHKTPSLTALTGSLTLPEVMLELRIWPGVAPSPPQPDLLLSRYARDLQQLPEAFALGLPDQAPEALLRFRRVLLRTRNIRQVVLMGGGEASHQNACLAIASSWFPTALQPRALALAELLPSDLPPEGGEVLLVLLGQTQAEIWSLRKQLLGPKVSRELRAQGRIITLGLLWPSIMGEGEEEAEAEWPLTGTSSPAEVDSRCFSFHQLLGLELLGWWLTEQRGSSSETSLRGSLQERASVRTTQLSSSLTQTLPILKQMATEAAPMLSWPSLLIFGRGAGLALARHAALLIKELACIHAEAISLGHVIPGPFSLLSPTMPVLFISLHLTELAEVRAHLCRMACLGIRITMILTQEVASALNQEVASTWHQIILPQPEEGGDRDLAGIALALIHYLGLELALQRGIDPDKPRYQSQLTMFGSV